MFYRLFSGKNSVMLRITAMLLGGLWMAVGYFAAEVILYGLPAALVELPATPGL